MISLDYSFLSSDDQETEGTMPVLNIRDAWSGKVAAEIVPRKGNNDYAVEVVTESIKRTGYKRIILKSYQEPSIIALKDAANAMQPAVNITMELPPVGESSSNAVIESQIGRTTALARVLKTCLESKLKKQILGDTEIAPWIVRHAGQVFNSSGAMMMARHHGS